MSNIPFLNNAYFSKDVGIGGEFTPNARLEIRDATNNNLRIGTRGGSMDLFSINNAGAAAPLKFEASEFNFITGDISGTNASFTGNTTFTGTGVNTGIKFNSTIVANDAFGIRVNGTSNNGELEFYSR